MPARSCSKALCPGPIGKEPPMRQVTSDGYYEEVRIIPDEADLSHER
jgi:hypothetical protein